MPSSKWPSLATVEQDWESSDQLMATTDEGAESSDQLAETQNDDSGSSDQLSETPNEDLEPSSSTKLHVILQLAPTNGRGRLGILRFGNNKQNHYTPTKILVPTNGR